MRLNITCTRVKLFGEKLFTCYTLPSPLPPPLPDGCYVRVRRDSVSVDFWLYDDVYCVPVCIYKRQFTCVQLYTHSVFLSERGTLYDLYAFHIILVFKSCLCSNDAESIFSISYISRSLVMEKVVSCLIS